MNVEAADLRSTTRQLEQTIERLKASLADVERDNVKKNIDIKTLARQVDHVAADLDSLKIDVAAHDTEAENLKSRIAALRDERETLRNELQSGKRQSARAGSPACPRRNPHPPVRSQACQGNRRAMPTRITSLERRAAEIERLKAKVKRCRHRPARRIEGPAGCWPDDACTEG